MSPVIVSVFLFNFLTDFCIAAVCAHAVWSRPSYGDSLLFVTFGARYVCQGNADVLCEKEYGAVISTEN